MALLEVGKSFCSSIGLNLLISSSRDMKVLLFLRMVRLFAFGGAALILALFLSELGFSDSKIGLFMTLTLGGDLLISLIITYVGDRLGVRITIIFGCLAMMAGGVAFAMIDNYWLLLLAAIVSVINPSGNEIDPFKAVEESAIARISSSEDCTEYFAWWSLLGMLGTAGSNLMTGFIIDKLQSLDSWTALDSYRAVFVGYAAVGLLKLLCCLFLSAEVEPSRKLKLDTNIEDETERRLLADAAAADDYDTFNKPPCNENEPDSEEVARMSSTSFLWRLCLSMFLDFIGSGLAQISWMIYFFKREYTINEGSLGLAIAVANVVSSLLNLAAGPLSRAIGQVPTMILCHTLNSITLLSISLPHIRILALVLFILRIVTRELDNAPRQAFISAGVSDEERTSAMGLVNATKIVGSGLGLFLTGQFANAGNFATAFILAGSLKLGYNFLMTVFFWKFWKNWNWSKQQ